MDLDGKYFKRQNYDREYLIQKSGNNYRITSSEEPGVGLWDKESIMNYIINKEWIIINKIQWI